VPKFKKSYKRIKDIEPIQPIKQRGYSITLGTYNFRRFQSGFTLFELLIAISIFALVLTTIYASSTGTFRVIGETESEVEIYRMARIAMERMLEDLESLYVQTGPVAGESAEGASTAPLFVGKNQEIDGRSADSLRFISRAHVNLGGQDQDPGAVQISYYVRESDEGDDLVLYRSDKALFEVSVSPEEETGGLVLCEGLVSVTLTYHDENGDLREGWDSDSVELKDKIPRMVSISLEFQDTSNPDVPVTFMTSIALPIEQGYTW
jgi:general secretion pathway protein J